MKTSIPKLHSIRWRNTDNVEQLPVVTNRDIDPMTVLMSAINERMTEVVIVGFDRDGNEYFASNKADGGAVLWHLERAKKKLIEIADEDVRERVI